MDLIMNTPRPGRLSSGAVAAMAAPRPFLDREEGAVLAEYVLLAGLIAIVVAIAASWLGPIVESLLQSGVAALANTAPASSAR